MKRLFALVLAMILILPCASFVSAEPAPVAADTTLSSWADLKAWAANGSNDKGTTIALGADISAPAGESWTAKDFAGTFDGQGHSITLPNGTDGLFAQLSGNVKNLRLKAAITTQAGTVGILSDRITGTITIENVMVEGSISSTVNNVGAFAGQIYLSGSKLEVNFVNCINAADVYCQQRYASGFVGNNESNVTNFTDCLNLGKVTVDGTTGEPIVAGFAGALYNGTGAFTRCINLGLITDNGSSAKGSCSFTYRANAGATFVNCLALKNSSDRLASEGATSAIKNKHEWMDEADDLSALSAFAETWLMATENEESFPVPATMAEHFESTVQIPPDAPADGYTITTRDGFEFTISEGKALLNSYFGLDTAVVIPEMVETFPVVRIESDAFAWCDQLTSITLPSGLTYIGNNAFRNCNRLAEVINLSSLAITAGSANNGGVALYAEEVHTGASKLVQNGDFLFMKIDGGYALVAYQGKASAPVFPTMDAPCLTVRGYSFAWNNNLSSVIVPEGVTAIGDWAFAYCKNLSELSLPSTLKTMGEAALRNCEALSSVVLPADMTHIGDYAFSCCYRLEKIVLPAGLEAVSNSLFSGCEKLSSVTLPEKATFIGNNAFYDCYALKSVFLPAKVDRIGDNAFYNCRSLESVVIPATVTTIGEAAFAWCNAFTTVNYGGTEAQWNAISVGEDNIELEEVNVVYSYSHTHNYGAWERDGEKHWKTCSLCGNVSEEGKHNMNANDTCSTCNYREGDFLLGDANGDGTVTFADIQRIYQHLSGGAKLTGNNLLAANANGDSGVNFSDIQRIYRHLDGGNKLF